MKKKETDRTPNELAAFFAYGISEAPESIGVVRMRDITIETKRSSKKRPTPEVTLSVQDDVIRALRGDVELGAEVLVVVVPRAVCDAHEDRERRRAVGIVLPSEV